MEDEKIEDDDEAIFESFELSIKDLFSLRWISKTPNPDEFKKLFCEIHKEVVKGKTEILKEYRKHQSTELEKDRLRLMQEKVDFEKERKLTEKAQDKVFNSLTG